MAAQQFVVYGGREVSGGGRGGGGVGGERGGGRGGNELLEDARVGFYQSFVRSCDSLFVVCDVLTHTVSLFKKRCA